MKALSRKRRGGRPRKTGERYANGNRKPSVIREESEREAKAVVIDARMRVLQMTEEQARSDLAGSMLGRLHMSGKLSTNKAESARMFEAGQRYGHDVWRYNMSILGVKPTVSAQNLLKVKGFAGDDDETAQKRNARISNVYMALEGVLLAAGVGVKATMRNVCVTEEVGDELPMSQMALLRRGLTALVGHYGIEER